MKILFNITAVLFALVIIGCGPDTSYQFSCGTEIKQEALKEFEVANKSSYKPLDLKLLGKLSLAIFDATARKKTYNVQFFENTRERLVVQVYGIWNLTEMDQAACAVLNFSDYQLPQNTLVIFYQNEKNDPKQHVVTGVRMKN